MGSPRHAPSEANSLPAPDLETAIINPKRDAADRFKQILEHLWNKDEKVRENGLKDLAEFQKDTQDPGSKIGIAALRAAARPYSFEKPDRDMVSSELVGVASSAPHSEYIPLIVELFDQLSDSAKWQAQVILTKLETREAAEAFMTIVRTYAPTGKLPGLVIGPLASNPRHADVFFPDILKYASNPKWQFEIHRLWLAYCEAKLLSQVQLAPFADQVLKAYDPVAKVLLPAQKDEGIAWMWEDAYEESRNYAALLLDLLGHFPGNRVESKLREALKYHDPRLKHFAIVSLLRLGKPVDKKHVADVARHAEMRNWLFIKLKEMDKASLFPEEFRTQKAFAEGDMVNWLVYPTELHRVPDEIELMKVVSVNTGLPGGIYDYYVFRFRTKEPHWAAKNGWIAGVSGPFLKKDQPTTNALGDTFSSFTKWEAKTPDEHVGDTRELIKKWNEYHSKNKQ